MRHFLGLLVHALFLGSLCVVLSDCGADRRSNSRQARLIWDERIASAEKLVHDEDSWLELEERQELGVFFYDLTGFGGIFIAHIDGGLTLDPRADEALTRLHEWCEANCSRLSLDPESGEVIVLAESKTD